MATPSQVEGPWLGPPAQVHTQRHTDPHADAHADTHRRMQRWREGEMGSVFRGPQRPQGATGSGTVLRLLWA